MKNFVLFFSLMVFLSFSASAQKLITSSTNLIGAGTQIVKTNSNYDYGVYAIGKQTTNGNVNVYRTYFEFSLNSIPTNATITQVAVSYTNGGSNYTLKLTQLATVNPSDLNATWGSIGSSTTFHSGLPYSGSGFNSNQIKSAIQSSLSNRVLYVGALSESESTEGSYSSMTLSLYVTYTYPAASLTLLVQNDLDGDSNGGSIGVGIYPSSAISRTSPYTLTAYENDKLNLAAYDNQFVNGYNYIFNNTEGVCYNSNWDKSAGGTTVNLSSNQAFTTPTLLQSDNYSTFSAHMKQYKVTTNGTLSTNEKWYSNVSLSGDVIIPANVQLTLFPCITVNLNGHSIISTGGAITDQGATISGLAAYIKSGSNAIVGYCSSVQNACNYVGSGQWVELQTRTYNESFSLSNKNQSYITGYGATVNGNVTVNSSTNCYLYGLNLGSGYRFEVNYGSGSRLIDASSSNCTVMYNYGTSNFEAQNFTATNGNDNEIGSYFYNSTGDVCAGSDFTNHMCGIYLGSNARINVTDNYFCNNGLDVYSESGSSAYLLHNTYSRINPLSVSGSYTYIQDYPERVCQNTMMAKTAGISDSRISTVTVENEADKMYLELLHKISKDELKDQKLLREKYRSDYDKIIAKTKDELKKNLSLTDLKGELSRIVHCYKWLDDKEALSSYLNELLNRSELKAVSPYIRRYNIEGLLDIQDYKGAILLADEILKKKDIDQDLCCEMLYERGIISKYFTKNNSEAYQAFSAIAEQYPKHTLAKMAKGQLSDIPKDSQRPYLKVVGEASNELKCTNYPNPFNPATTFNFSIPKDGYTELKIYNSLGQEVKTLVSEQLAKGQYSFEWNAISYSSGIYYYTLKCGDMVSTHKMILMK